jgi:hypothetical protein
MDSSRTEVVDEISKWTVGLGVITCCAVWGAG